MAVTVVMAVRGSIITTVATVVAAAMAVQVQAAPFLTQTMAS